MTEEEVKKLFKDEFERYFREVHGTFVVEAGCPTDRHEPAEYSMTTQSAQGISFYEGGIGKMRAGKNLEIYSVMMQVLVMVKLQERVVMHLKLNVKTEE